MQQQRQKQKSGLRNIIKSRVNSRERLELLQKQQQQLSQAFKIDNFYTNKKLDIQNLKSKIGEIKKKSQNTNQIITLTIPPKNNENPEQQPQTFIPLNNRIQKLYLYKKDRVKLTSGAISRQIEAKSSRKLRNSSAFDKKSSLGQKLTIQNTSNRTNFNKESNNVNLSQQLEKYSIKINGRFQSIDKNKTITYFGKNGKNKFQQEESEQNSQQSKLKSNFIPKIQNIGGRRNMQSNQKYISMSIEKQKQLQREGNSSRLEPISSYKKKLLMLKIQNPEQLKQFETNIHSLWSIYEKLSKLVQILSYQGKQVLNQNITSQELVAILQEYKGDVCSTKLEFLVKIIDTCLEFSHAKTVILSRLLQSLSVVYIILQILQQTLYSSAEKGKSNEFSSSHLVNFVGICSNNILLIIRLITLVSAISSKVVLSENTSNIFRAILDFQISSYRSQINCIKDTIIRIEHNNELTTMIQSKINNKMYTKDYHKGCFGQFVKGVIIDRLKEQIQVASDKNMAGNSQTKPFFQYSYFIFEYLAFHIHHQQCLGLFPKEIQTAPYPYLPLKKQFTIIIDPRVLVYEGKNKIFVRSHADHFLQALNQKCNVVFWNERMPNEIDSICDLVDISPGQQKQNRSQLADFNKNASNKNEIKRLYKHHCFYDFNSKGQLALIKDVSRIGCPSGKYIILDNKFENYYLQQENHTILLPWRGEARDSKLSVVLDILLPFFREGTNLDKSLKLLKPRLEQLLRVKKYNNTNSHMQH